MITRPVMPAPPEYIPPAADEADIDAAVEASKSAYEAAVLQHRADWKAAIQQWEADRLAAEERLPRHALAGAWLKANPTEGVEAVDRGDGLGPRLLGWPDNTPAPDLAAFAVTYTPPVDPRVARLAAIRSAPTLAALRTAIADYLEGR